MCAGGEPTTHMFKRRILKCTHVFFNVLARIAAGGWVCGGSFDLAFLDLGKSEKSAKTFFIVVPVW